MTQLIATLLDEGVPNFPNRVVTLMSPCAHWRPSSNTNAVTRWAEAALTIPYTEEVGQSVIDTLLQIASVDRLLPYIPADVWAWLKKQPSLPPICHGRLVGTADHVVRKVRGLGDVGILEAYFLLVWSEWDLVRLDGFREMCISIREDLGGIGMGRSREVLTKRLDHVLGELDRGLGHLKQQNPTFDEDHIPAAREGYGALRELLLKVDREALEILTRTLFRLFNLFDLLTSGCTQNPTRRSFALSLSHVHSRHSPIDRCPTP